MTPRLYTALLTEAEAVRSCDKNRPAQSITIGSEDHLTLQRELEAFRFTDSPAMEDAIFGIPLVVDPSIPAGEVHFKTASGATIRIRNVQVPE